MVYLLKQRLIPSTRIVMKRNKPAVATPEIILPILIR